MTESLDLQFHHVGLHVGDLDRALRFFAGSLQLEILGRDEESASTLLSVKGLDTPPSRVRLRLPETEAELRLIANPSADGVNADHANPGTCHVCFYTDNLTGMWSRLSGKGEASLCSTEIVRIKGGVFDGGRCIYCAGPDGIRIEFLEGPAYLDGSRRPAGAGSRDQRANESSHVGIHVRDRDRSLAFYRDLLGMEEVAGWLEATPSTRAVIGYPEAELWMSILRLPGTQSFFEVIEYRGTAGVPIDNSLRQNGVCHLAFSVNSLGELRRKIATLGLRELGVAVPVGHAQAELWIEDPDGYRVRFTEAHVSAADRA